MIRPMKKGRTFDEQARDLKQGRADSLAKRRKLWWHRELQRRSRKGHRTWALRMAKKYGRLRKNWLKRSIQIDDIRGVPYTERISRKSAVPMGRPHVYENISRDKQIRKRYGDGGESINELGKVFGITKQRVWQIVSKEEYHPLPKYMGGRYGPADNSDEEEDE